MANAIRSPEQTAKAMVDRYGTTDKAYDMAHNHKMDHALGTESYMYWIAVMKEIRKLSKGGNKKAERTVSMDTKEMIDQVAAGKDPVDVISDGRVGLSEDVLARFGLIDMKKWNALMDRLDEDDEQARDLAMAVASELNIKIEQALGQDGIEALGRLFDITSKGQNWDTPLLRNNIFKAAHALGIELPSHNF